MLENCWWIDLVDSVVVVWVYVGLGLVTSTRPSNVGLDVRWYVIELLVIVLLVISMLMVRVWVAMGLVWLLVGRGLVMMVICRRMGVVLIRWFFDVDDMVMVHDGVGEGGVRCF